MSSQDRLVFEEGLHITPFTSVLAASWPILVTLTPESVGLGSNEEATLEFLRIVQALSDTGLLSYEALLIGSDGPILIDATLTARGRAAFSE
ncbi:hypothetical protein [Sphingomonas sp. JC676]|uniref:hypothetical protein n=1 Tax=Sphingomonas sp. JC676 TaxID=2768065 RepID=UPI00223B1F5A|nr:hypothetical protein [Sphingomonas sp. JC676]